ncbi:hypothetical protein FVF58_06880 [Paraburkholderia panacisoli]|uniref:Branched-chain amino acid ABC transporter permease n=1 Tax=Paraburkholderia panacisoli TaxID=2603818 RepID=A0A5B0HHM4_9BURK|nr:hypothetical protein [Paraburkholderia panacisoli]KAA1014600.1 hypothetical protein FVF58_06880 [Paraburkholderia panacisoli]
MRDACVRRARRGTFTTSCVSAARRVPLRAVRCCTRRRLTSAFVAIICVSISPSGHNITFYKIAAFAISAAPAGLGGALYAHYQLQVSPQLLSVFISILVITMAYVGGLGSIYGAAGGAVLLNLLTELLRSIGEFRLLAYSVVLILILFFRPGGLVAPLWRLLRGGRE